MLTKLFAKEYGINKYVRKKFGGHSIKDLTDRFILTWILNGLERK